MLIGVLVSALSIKLQKYCSFLSFSLVQLIFNYFMQIRTTLQKQWRFTFLVVFSNVLIIHVRWGTCRFKPCRGECHRLETRSSKFRMSALIIELVAGEKMPWVTYCPGWWIIPSGSGLVGERWTDVWWILSGLKHELGLRLLITV